MAETRERITKRRILPEKVLKEVEDPSAGGTVVFIGTVRNKGSRGAVAGLEYQAYKGMAEKRMRGIEAEVKKRWPVKKVALLHREGSLGIGEVSVVVAVSAEHRAEAFEACHYAIDRIKASLPIWKKERTNSSGGWVEGTRIEG